MGSFGNFLFLGGCDRKSFAFHLTIIATHSMGLQPVNDLAGLLPKPRSKYTPVPAALYGLLPPLFELHPWAFVVLVDEDDARGLKCLLD